MMIPIRKTHPLFKIVNGALVDMPIPSNISIFWHFGSLLGLCLAAQIATGLFLAMHYTASVDLPFSSVAHICRDVNYGWLLRTLHANGASFFLHLSLFTYRTGSMLWFLYNFSCMICRGYYMINGNKFVYDFKNKIMSLQKN